MMDDTLKLRKADIFSGLAIVFIGLFIIWQALQMPMKDSWGGVQNVWFVSPALFPLLVGGMLVLLGCLLMRTALTAVGLSGMKSVLGYLLSHDFAIFLTREDTVRFYGIVFNLIVFVFIMVPHVDFFLSAAIFLLVFFFMFYCAGHAQLLALLGYSAIGTIIIGALIFSGLQTTFSSVLSYPADWLTLAFLISLVLYGLRQFRTSTEQQRKLRLSFLIAFLAPLTIGIIFKYFLLVPMPFEGVIVSLLDAIWYAEIWS